MDRGGQETRVHFIAPNVQTKVYIKAQTLKPHRFNFAQLAVRKNYFFALSGT